MKTTAVCVTCLAIVACSSSTPSPSQGNASGSASQGGSGSSSGTSNGGSGQQASGASTGGESGAASGEASSGGGSGMSTGGAAGSANGGSGATTSSGSPASGAEQGDATAGTDASFTLDDGGVYMGTPFALPAGHTMTIPGKIYVADYDNGGPGVAYCHGNPANCPQGIRTDDWRGAAGLYRPAATGAQVCGGAACNDNAGICHMNNGEPDNYANTGSITLDGAMYSFTAGTAVNPYDTYICYMVSPTSSGGASATYMWSKYTVQVLEAGTYSVGGQFGSPGGVTVALEFGDGITTGPMPIPASPTNNCKCPETYHSWEVVGGLGTVTFNQPGTYVMTFLLLTQQFNPDFFVFTKM